MEKARMIVWVVHTSNLLAAVGLNSSFMINSIPLVMSVAEPCSFLRYISADVIVPIIIDADPYRWFRAKLFSPAFFMCRVDNNLFRSSTQTTDHNSRPDLWSCPSLFAACRYNHAVILVRHRCLACQMMLVCVDSHAGPGRPKCKLPATT